VVSGKYRVIGEIGRGGMGVVYKAQDIRLKRTVALKFLPPDLTRDLDARERFVREGQAASALDHINICTIHEIDEIEDGELYISMAFYEGETVEDKIARGPVDVDEALSIAAAVARGLAKAHDAGIIHRDIKPTNLMVTADGIVKVMDFGLAMLAGQTRLTTDGSPVGTVTYMSPEQVNSRPVDQRTDIWSLGVVLYEMIAGEKPFKGNTPAAAMFSIVSKAPPPVTSLKPGCPVDLDRILSKALAKDPYGRYQHAGDMLVDLRGLGATLETGSDVAPQVSADATMTGPGSDSSLSGGPSLEGAQTFRDVKASKESQTSRAFQTLKPIAVVSFENQTGDPAYDYLQRAIPNLLITSLEHSENLRVTTWERMQDLLRIMGREDVEIIDKDLGFELCRMDGVDTIAVGSVTKAGDVFATDVKVLDVETKTLKKSASSRGKGVASILEKQIDELSREISLGTGLSKRKIAATQVKIAEVTTSSMEAYRHYLEGADYDLKLYYAEAEQSFRKALEFDPGFAMAYYGLAALECWNPSPDRKELVSKALEQSDRVSPRERFYIHAQAARFSGDYALAIEHLGKLLARYPGEKMAHLIAGVIHYYDLHQCDEAVRHLRRAVEIDPLFKMPYNMLAYVHNQTGDLEKSIAAINRYIELAPYEANPYDTRGDLYAYNGDLDRAIESYRKALERKPDLYDTLSILTPLKLGHMYLFKRDYDQARACYERVCSSSQKTTRSFGRTYMALIPLYQGKFGDALKVLSDGLEADTADGVEGPSNAFKHALRSSIYEQTSNLAGALEEVEACIEIYQRLRPEDKVTWRAQLIQILAQKGEIPRATEAASKLRVSIDKRGSSSADMSKYLFAVGWIERANGHLDAATAHFERAARKTRHFRQHYMLGRAYLESGRLGEAVEELKATLGRFDYMRTHDAISAVKGYYYLGLAYEKSGWSTEAMRRYEEFLETWKDADQGTPEIDDAKERLAALRSGTQSRT
jgi:serine/threonine protein kinase/tetratricopeptide (TPR) repeat protein